MKKLLNTPVDAVKEMIEGMVAIHPYLVHLEDYPGVIVRRDFAADQALRDSRFV